MNYDLGTIRNTFTDHPSPIATTCTIEDGNLVLDFGDGDIFEFPQGEVEDLIVVLKAYKAIKEAESHGHPAHGYAAATRAALRGDNALALSLAMEAFETPTPPRFTVDTVGVTTRLVGV